MPPAASTLHLVLHPACQMQQDAAFVATTAAAALKRTLRLNVYDLDRNDTIIPNPILDLVQRNGLPLLALGMMSRQHDHYYEHHHRSDHHLQDEHFRYQVYKGNFTSPFDLVKWVHTHDHDENTAWLKSFVQYATPTLQRSMRELILRRQHASMAVHARRLSLEGARIRRNLAKSSIMVGGMDVTNLARVNVGNAMESLLNATSLDAAKSNDARESDLRKARRELRNARVWEVYMFSNS